MGLPTTFIVVYLLGGLTFLPLLLALVLLYAHLTLPRRCLSSSSGQPLADVLRDVRDDGKNLKSTASVTGLAEKFHRRQERDVAAGYFAVCREYVPGGVNGKPPERTTPVGAVAAAESPSVYQSMYRSIFDRRQGPSLDPGRGNGKSVKRARNVFFVVLRHGHLMLYEDHEQAEVKHVISLELHDVGIYGGEEAIPEGELWIKRNAIRLQRKSFVEDPTSTSKPFYFFSENSSEKEDFYFALLQNQDVEPGALENPPRPQQFDTRDIISLVQQLHSSEEHLQTRWINALVGRLFLALYKTEITEDFIRKKITKKIARVKKPAFLSGIILRKIDTGDSAPHITNPRLKDLTIDGDCCVEADFRYGGNFRLEIAATARIDLGARFKVREVHLVLAVVVKKLNGHALVKFKPPPSNRIWIAFETMPDLEMTIEPIVSSRQITYGIILRTIESRIREVIAETFVLPHWDDSPFTDSSHQKFRGGIWSDESVSDHSQPEHTKIPDEAPEDEAEADVEMDAAPVVQGSLQTKDERSTSIPVVPGAPTSIPFSKAATSSAQVIVDPAKEATSTALQKRNELPKALRSRSFASAANPLLSMDNANVDSTQKEKSLKQQRQDAASAIKAISNRPRPSSPSDHDERIKPDTTALGENDRNPSSRSSLLSDVIDHGEPDPHVAITDSPGQVSLPSTLTSTSSRSLPLGFNNDTQHPKALQGDTRSTGNSEKRQSVVALGAATAAAKNWGWSMLSRNSNQKQLYGANQDSTGNLSQPIGRGRPLPPPGQPLPFPEGTRSKITGVIPPKRKPLASPVMPSRKQDEVKARMETPPPLPVRKRQKSRSLSNAGDEGLLIVEAPYDFEPSSPMEEKAPEATSSIKAEPKHDYIEPSVEDSIEDSDGDSADNEILSPDRPILKRAPTTKEDKDGALCN